MMKRFPSLSGNARILMITTGGTIVQKFDKELGGYAPKTTGKELIDSISSEVDLERIDLVEYAMIDSRFVDLNFLHGLSKLVQESVMDDNIDGIVIVHGTDTMEITAYHLHRTVQCFNKAVVITGAMRVVTNNDYDGKANITNAIKQVSSPHSMIYGHGVSINFAGKIHSPVNVFKEHSFAIDPFSSGNFGVIGMMASNRVDWLNNPKKSSIIPLPEKLQSIPTVFAFPGATEDCLDGFVGKFKGIVIVAYGSGNVSEKMYLAIKKAITSGLKIALVTNCRYGGVYAEYGGVGGNQSLKDLGVFMANDLNPYQAMVVASLVFGNEKVENNPKSFLEKYFSNKEF
jgi:L-asparaginase